MKIWDIIDETYPDEITVVSPAPERTILTRARIGSIPLVTSKIRVAVAVVAATIVTSSAHFQLDRPVSAATQRAAVPVYVARDIPPLAEERSGSIRGPQSSSATDTQRGLSTVKLSRAFAAYYQPAPVEDDYEEDYLFG